MQRENIRHVEEWARPRTVVLLTLLLLAALWAVVIASLVFARDDSIAAAGISLQRLTHALEQQTRQQFRLLDTVLAASENWLQDHPAGDPHRDSGLRRLVDSLRDSSGDFFDIRLLAAGTDPALQASPAGSDRSERQPGGSRLAFGRPTTDPATARVHLPVVRPVNNRHANGLQMVAMVDLQALSHGYDAERLRPGGAIALLSPDGTVLAQAAEDRQLVHSLAGGHLFSRHLPQAVARVRRSRRTRRQASAAVGELLFAARLPARRHRSRGLRCRARRLATTGLVDHSAGPGGDDPADRGCLAIVAPAARARRAQRTAAGACDLGPAYRRQQPTALRRHASR